MNEIFEEYIKPSDPEWVAKYCEMFGKRGIEGILQDLFAVHLTCGLDIHEQYVEIVHAFTHAYAATKQINVPGSDQLDILLHGFYDLDIRCGIACDSDLGSDSASDSDSETDLKNDPDLIYLAKLDEDFANFKNYYINTKSRLNGIYGKWFQTFAELIFLFNGYQAPARLDPAQAVRDAMGLTDVFDELLGAY